MWPVREADNHTTYTCRMSWKSGSLNLLESFGPHLACYGTPLPLALPLPFTCHIWKGYFEYHLILRRWNLTWILFKTNFLPSSKHPAYITKIILLMWYRKLIAVCCVMWNPNFEGRILSFWSLNPVVDLASAGFYTKVNCSRFHDKNRSYFVQVIAFLRCKIPDRYGQTHSMSI
jgi:hypothetical protein